MSLFSEQPIEYVSQCCGADTYERDGIVRCHRCHDSCKTVLKGEEMKSTEGGIYCQVCAGKLFARVQRGFVLKYPASRNNDKGTCWGCGTTLKLREASVVIKKEKP